MYLILLFILSYLACLTCPTEEKRYGLSGYERLATSCFCFRLQTSNNTPGKREKMKIVVKIFSKPTHVKAKEQITQAEAMGRNFVILSMLNEVATTNKRSKIMSHK
ncbi:CLUMA_CG019212, isoform A [Clunio marinus]|uniref:CLUMA_CG019212, isoform A n=1 Tax=Clunio marinus TaxID=568069 RepID=A0A1J1J339_9DIPT|nr:CLUMA_CG019212, isoform A [Clunio marinus]